MRVWYFSEQSYHPAWEKWDGPSKVVIPNELCDPAEAGALMNRYLDEWMVADEEGLDIMVNEHHSSSNCMSASCTLTLAILARQTKNARLLALGIPTANRPDPRRVAEEIAMVDIISGGRLEVGLVKGSPNELPLSNLRPARMMDRYWEAHDLIRKALVAREPFPWEGEYFQYRNVNIWPRALQQPTPPFWITASSAASARRTAQLGYKLGTLMNGGNAKGVFAAYRDEYRKAHGVEAPSDRTGYLCMMVTGESDAIAQERARKLLVYLNHMGRAPAFSVNPPGYETVATNVKALRAGARGMLAMGTTITPSGRKLPPDPSLEDYAEAGVLFSGTPDRVYEQIVRFSDGVGGIDNLLMLGQAGYLGHEDTVSSIRLFAREVYPRLREREARTVSTAA